MTILAIIGCCFLASVIGSLLFCTLCYLGNQHDDPDPNLEEDVLLLGKTQRK